MAWSCRGQVVGSLEWRSPGTEVFEGGSGPACCVSTFLTELPPTTPALASGGGASAEAAFMEVLQKKMESTVLGMQSGSYAQRVQAEYLKEVEARAKTVFRQLAAAGK